MTYICLLNVILSWAGLCSFSAGIGQTGTFIALNILIDQGKQLGYVDVAACVENLRKQRVNMVQNLVMYLNLVDLPFSSL